MRYPPLYDQINAFEKATDSFRTLLKTSQSLAKSIVDYGQWAQVFACLDALRDTSALLHFYSQFLESKAESEPSYHSGTGELYMNLYGVLQGLYVQQDALTHLSKAFGISINFDENYTGIARARELRNFSVGHPTKKGRIKKRRHVYSDFPDDAFVYARIQRDSLSRDSFALEVSGKLGGETRLHHLQPIIIAHLKDAVSILELICKSASVEAVTDIQTSENSLQD